MMSFFTPETLSFLADLAQNNDRAWFQANKARFERHLKTPMLALIEALGPHFEHAAPDYVADPRPVGGSMFRIFRDTRFARDKSPYKTHAAAQFRHRSASKDVHGPGFYLHIEPGASMMGAGIWQPDSPSLAAIRAEIGADPVAWAEAQHAVAPFTRWGEQGKRVPAGFPATHPAADELRWKDFVWTHTLGDDEVCDPELPEQFGALCGAAAPVMDFLARAVRVGDTLRGAGG